MKTLKRTGLALIICACVVLSLLLPATVVSAESVTYTFEELIKQDKVKIQGRHTPGKATAYWSGNAVEMNIELASSDMSIDITTDEAKVYFEVISDGKSVCRTSVTPEKSKISLNKLISAGRHTVRVVRETGTDKTGNAHTCFESVTLDGEILERPQDNELFIEIIGDSISCGLGSLGAFAQGTVWRVEDHSATHSFGYYVAGDLNADYSIVASGGVGFYDQSTGKNQKVTGVKTTIQDMYEYTNGVDDYGNESAKYKPERIPDLIILRIGANDDKDNEVLWKKKLVEFINRIREINGADIPILFSGETGKDHYDTVKGAQKKELKDYPLYLKSFTLGRSGSAALATQTSGHPNAKEQRDLSLALLETIEINNLAVPLDKSAAATNDGADSTETIGAAPGNTKYYVYGGIAAGVIIVTAVIIIAAVASKKKKAAKNPEPQPENKEE